jgi:hypothetical protein
VFIVPQSSVKVHGCKDDRYMVELIHKSFKKHYIKGYNEQILFWQRVAKEGLYGS